MKYIKLLLILMLQACSIQPANSQHISPKYAIPVTLVVDSSIDRKAALRSFLTAVIEVKNRTGVVFYPGLIFTTNTGREFGSGYAFMPRSKGFVFTIRRDTSNNTEGNAAPSPDPSSSDKDKLCALTAKWGLADSKWHEDISYTIAHELFHWLGAEHAFGGIMLPIHVDGLTRTYNLHPDNVSQIDKCLLVAFGRSA